jgi:hypothetical protein
MKMLKKTYQFNSPESSCHTYLVRTPYDLKFAMKLFYDWQKDYIEKDNQWPMEVIQDPKNWTTNVTGVYIIE